MSETSKRGQNTEEGKKGFQKTLNTTGKVAPTSKIEQDILDVMLKYHNGESIDIHYAKIFSRFSQSQEKIEKDISDMTRGQSLSRSIYMFNKIEADALREASEAIQAAEAITSMSMRVYKEGKDPVANTIFSIARSEAMEKAEQLTLKYLAAVEARRAFETEMDEEKGRV